MERFGESQQHELRQAVCVEEPLEEVLSRQQVGCGRVPGNYQGTVNGVSQVNGEQRFDAGLR